MINPPTSVVPSGRRPQPRSSTLRRTPSLKYPSVVPAGGRYTSVTVVMPNRLSVPSDPSPNITDGARVSQARPLSLIEHRYNLGIQTSLSRSSSSSSAEKALRVPRRSASCLTTTRNPMRPAKIQRWEGLIREASDWDGLRRDPDLWFGNGDCLVHLYARGQSRRGPSFRVSFETLRAKNCSSMFSLCYAQMFPSFEDNTSGSGRASSECGVQVSGSNRFELFIPPPEDALRDDAFRWHITTRNFFAYIFDKPLVGEHLGQAFVDLQQRMRLFRSGPIDNFKDMIDYADRQGYRNLVDCPDYALAMLYYAETFKIRDIWIDAFAHCVGMNEVLTLSAEFPHVSRLTKALITRAYLEMDIQIGRVNVALRNFLEDDLSPAYLGLPDGARAHLDRFRSFLHGFYVDKFGYWPPLKRVSFPKTLFKSMYVDFKSLYDYLVDLDSTTDLSAQKPASGGICVLQNVDSFDKRHSFVSLPNPLPLLPSNDSTTRRRTESQKGLRTLTLGSKQAATDSYTTARATLAAATNSHDSSVTSCPIVQAYIRYERQCVLNQRQEKVSMADARKVRWLLIYGTLQYLISALRAPKEVRDTESPTYPLCCLVTEQSPWQVGTKALILPSTQSINDPTATGYHPSKSNTAAIQPMPAVQPEITIQPDCQMHRYFAHTNTDSESGSIPVEVPAPLKISQTSRRSSIRSLRRLSLSSRSSRTDSVQLKATPYYEIIVPGYGNGTTGAIVDLSSQRSSTYSTSSISSSQPVSQAMSRPLSTNVKSTEYVFGYPLPMQSRDLETNIGISSEPDRTPTMDPSQVETPASPVVSITPWTLSSSSDSTISVDNPFWSDGASSQSSKSSTYGELDRKFNPAEESGLLGGLVPIENLAKSKRSLKVLLPMAPTPTTHCDEFRFSFDKQTSPFQDYAEELPVLLDTDPDIGIALSTPLRPSAPITSLSVDNLILTDKKTDYQHSSSTEHIPCIPPNIPRTSRHKKRSSDPIRDDVIDIFTALDAPSQLKVIERDCRARRTGIDTHRSLLGGVVIGVVPSITKSPQTLKKADRKKAFWRR